MVCYRKSSGNKFIRLYCFFFSLKHKSVQVIVWAPLPMEDLKPEREKKTEKTTAKNIDSDSAQET